MFSHNAIVYALLGTGFTFLMTALGSALVFLFKKDITQNSQRIFLGFAAGIMIAASVWSLLIPAMEMSRALQQVEWLAAAGGFLIGGFFLFCLDKLLPHLHLGSEKPEGLASTLDRTTMLVLAVTLHNIPEGLAVGLTFGLAAEGEFTLASAIVLALGIGLQNFPEGAAISLPLKKEGASNLKAFTYGALSGAVEPVAGLIGVLLAGAIAPIMPWFLAFAAGAMIYVVVEELIPEASIGEHSHTGTAGVMAGFLIMMILDVALG